MKVILKGLLQKWRRIGEHGAMPAKGFCNLCDEQEIRKSVFYMFHLAKKAQKAQTKRDSLEKISINF